MENIVITQEQLEETVNKAVETAKVEFKKTLNPFAGQTEVKKEANPQIVGAFVKALAQSHLSKTELKSVAESMNLKSGSYASQIVSKAVNESTATEGQEFINPVLSNEFIDSLYNANVVRAAGPMMLQMNGAELRIPYGTNQATALWETELLATATKTNFAFDKYVLTPKRLMCWTTISNDLLNDSSIRTDAIVQSMIIKAMANKEEVAIFNGTGLNNQPTGLYGWIAAGNKISSGGTTAELIEADLLEALSKTIGSNSTGNYKWFMTPRSFYAMTAKVRAVVGSLAFPELRGPQPTLFGIPVVLTNNIPSNGGVGTNEAQIWLVNLDDLVIADRMPISVKVNPYQNSTLFPVGINETLIYVEERIDLLLKHDVAAAVIEGCTF